MKKLLVVVMSLAVAGAGGWYAYTHWMAPPEIRACDKVAELCGADAEQRRSCLKALRELKKVGGEKPLEKAATCVESAESCVRATGCLAGASLGSVGEFFKGVVDGVTGGEE